MITADATLFSLLDAQIIRRILKWPDLTYRDYLALTLAEPNLMEIDYQYPLEPRLIRFLVIRLGGNSELVDELLSMIRRYDCMLSGSIMLGLAYDMTWPDADLDIFVPVATPHTYSQLDRLLRPYKISNPITNDEEYKKYSQFYRGSSKFVAIRQYEIPVVNNFPLKIQLINVANTGVGYRNVREFIKNEFDFDFCKIGFDGDRVWIAEEARKAISNRSCAPNYIVPETLTRMQKYLKRGFRFIGVKEYIGYKIKKKPGRIT